jgi:hypothetical protein
MSSDQSLYPEEGNGEASGDAYEAALQEALGESPRSLELRDMVMTLKIRYRRLSAEMDTLEDDVERERLRRDLNKLAEQIKVLSEEAEINAFVEDTLRVNIEMRKFQE